MMRHVYTDIDRNGGVPVLVPTTRDPSISGHA